MVSHVETQAVEALRVFLVVVRELSDSVQRPNDRLSRPGRAAYSSRVRSRRQHRTFPRVVFLGSGSRYGAAREAALKMLEMTAGRVTTMSETSAFDTA
jgi:fructoselysine-6-P-deglycase FrlB-like protein